MKRSELEKHIGSYQRDSPVDEALKSRVRKRSPGEGCVHLEAGAELGGAPIFNG